jgi:3'5'-cyclic nucleotide phosphodiesterase
MSALIHDVDHVGVPNATLVAEGAEVALKYDNQSPAEQNSINLAWTLLMDDRYAELRNTIYTTEAEMKRFRALIVNSVMATDICDKSLTVLRNSRWDKAFNGLEDGKVEEEHNSVNRKATIVIEHLIQASDVSHTMQHVRFVHTSECWITSASFLTTFLLRIHLQWHMYRKWNEKFFMECYEGFLDGRSEADPSIGWYKGEIG